MTSYHDRIDIRTDIDNRETLSILRRSLFWLWPQGKLLGTRLFLVVLVFLIGLPLPWFLKIVVDHGVQQIPIEDEMLYPFFMDPLLTFLSVHSPLDITLYTLLLLAFIFLLVGYSGNTYLEANLAEGADVATQSENKVSAGFSSAHGLLGFLDLSVAIRLSQKITHEARAALFSKMSRFHLVALQQQRSGDAMFRIMHDTPAIAGICHALTVNPFTMVISVTLNLWVLWMVYGSTAPELVWLGFTAVIFTLILTSPLAKWMRTASQASRSSGSATLDDLEEGLKQVSAIQSLGGVKQEQGKFRNASQESFKQSLVLVSVKNVVIWVADNIHLIFQTLGFWIIFNGIIDGTLTLGDTPVILRMYSLLYETSLQFGQIWIEQQDNAAAARRVLFMLDHEAEDRVESNEKRLNLGSKDGIQFKDVSFTYPDGRQALKAISFHALPRETIAIVGTTGAGKTTLASMIPRFIDPSSGSIIIDGIDIVEITKSQLRQEIAYVFQEHQLLSDTVEANLRIGNPSASIEELKTACEQAGALAFIESMPHGFNSLIERGGGTLSTGQKQRISIARALLRRASILVLDEPTAALDPETESSLVKAINESENNLTIIIAHRLSTIRHADRILFLEQGEIVEEGKHEDLMELSEGRYQRFVHLASS